MTDLWRYLEDGIHPDIMKAINEGMQRGVFEASVSQKDGLMHFNYCPEAPGCRRALKTLKYLHAPSGQPYHYALFKRTRMYGQSTSHKLVVGTSLRAVRDYVRKKEHSYILKVLEHS